MPRHKTPTTDARKAILYIRVSTDEQRLGPVAQRDAARAWAAAHNVEIVAEHEDHGVSGAKHWQGCPALMAALSSLEEHNAGILLVAKFDRLSRDMMKALTVENEVEKLGAKVISAAGEGGDGDDPASKMMRGIIKLFSAYERDLISARTCAALRVKKADGKRIGSIPYGFSVDTDGKTLIPNDEERRLLAEVRAMRAAGDSLRDIVAKNIVLRGRVCRHPNDIKRFLEAEV